MNFEKWYEEEHKDDYVGIYDKRDLKKAYEAGWNSKLELCSARRRTTTWIREVLGI